MAAVDQRILRVGVEVDGQILWYEGLRITAKGSRAVTDTQNTASVEIANLSRDVRNYLLTETSPFNTNRSPKRLYVEAGRVSTGVAQVFVGDIVSASPTQPPDIGLKLQAQTGAFKKGALVARSGQAKDKLSVIARQVADDLESDLIFEADDRFIANWTFSGATLRQVDALSRAGGAFDIAFGGSTSRWGGAVNGSGSEENMAFALQAFSHVRVGTDRLAAAQFSGSISDWTVYRGFESLSWMERETSPKVTLEVADKSRIVIIGDSYTPITSTGFGGALVDAGEDTINLGVGGSTSAEQIAVFDANSNLHGLMWEYWDGSPNGFVSLATEKAQLEHIMDTLAAASASGTPRFLYHRGGLIPGYTNPEVKDDLWFWFKAKYGDEYCFDAFDTVASFAITDPDAAGYATDQLNISNGFFPSSALFDLVHLEWAVRGAVVAASASKRSRMLAR